MSRPRRMSCSALALLACLISPSVRAQSSESGDKRALAIEIVDISAQSVDIDQLLAAVLDQVARNTPNATAEARQTILSLGPLMRSELEPMMKDVSRLAARFYEERFEVDELRLIRDFTASPAGRKQSRLGAEFAGRFSATLQQTMAQRMPALGAKIKEELTKRGHKL